MKFDQGSRYQIGHYQIETASVHGNIAIDNFDPVFHSVYDGIFACYFNGLCIYVYARYHARAELRGTYGKYAGARTDIQDISFFTEAVLKQYILNGHDAHHGGGMLPSAEGHSRIYINDNIVAGGGISFPGWFYYYVITHPERFKVFFPLFSPVGIDYDLCGEAGFSQFGEY